jgi:hypothetical protein
MNPKAGPPMIAHERLAEIRRLLGEPSISQVQIAQMTGVSRGTVRAIAKDPELADRRRDRALDRISAKRKSPRRCPTCGGKVYLPCRLCRVRAYAARIRRNLIASPPRAKTSAKANGG